MNSNGSIGSGAPPRSDYTMDLEACGIRPVGPATDGHPVRRSAAPCCSGFRPFHSCPGAGDTRWTTETPRRRLAQLNGESVGHAGSGATRFSAHEGTGGAAGSVGVERRSVLPGGRSEPVVVRREQEPPPAEVDRTSQRAQRAQATRSTPAIAHGASPAEAARRRGQSAWDETSPGTTGAAVVADSPARAECLRPVLESGEAPRDGRRHGE
jgi:hypothetical protein